MNSGNARSAITECRSFRHALRLPRLARPPRLPDLPRLRGPLCGLLAGLLVLSVACDQSVEAPLTEYDIPLLGPDALLTELGKACTSAVDQAQPLLLEFSAPWCSDCQKLHQMKQQSALANELANWPKITINVGNFDAHRDLLEAFEVTQIAHWAVLAPNRCAAAAESWPRLAQRTIEPSSGKERSQSPADLANWLLAFRVR